MQVMVVDKGGRGNAIAHTFARSPQVSKVYVAPGNAGSSLLKKCEQIPVESIDKMANFAIKNNVDITFVGPEGYLSDGIVDVFEEAGLPIIGPTKKATILEGSKCYTKDFLNEIGVPIPRYKNFDDPSEAKAYVREFIKETEKNVVVKADGLAAGKGSIVCNSLDDALRAIDEIMVEKIFGDSGNKVDIEERLYGEELMFFAFTDGKTILPMEGAQDYKRAFDENDKLSMRSFGNRNPNTGGMGGYSPHPWLDEKLRNKIMDRIAIPTIKNFRKLKGIEYKGIIYFGVMICEENGEKNPYVLEINVRMGDPEAQVILPRLKTDMYDISDAILNVELNKINLEWNSTYYLGICAVSGRIGRFEGYPGKHHTNQVISGLDEVNQYCLVFHNGTAFNEDGKLYTTGGRVLTLVGRGDTLEEAREIAYNEIKKVHFRGMRYRKSIGRT